MMTNFRNLVDLASRRLGSSVMAASDEAFAEKENLINAHKPTFSVETFGNKGQEYDGWETRRRRDDGHDWAIVRLGAPGRLEGVVIDTAFFKGNYPPFVSLEATCIDGTPSLAEVQNAEWTTLLPKSDAVGDSENEYAIKDSRWWTHLRLNMYPDGGIARLRAYGTAVADPRWLAAVGTVNLGCIDIGADLVECSDAFYSSARNTLQPGNAINQGDGWENRRRRGGGNDFFTVRLGIEGQITAVEVDTQHFKGNPPGWIQLTQSASGKDGSFTPLVDKTAVLPDGMHRYRISEPTATQFVRLDVYPDGGLGRLRLWGRPTSAALAKHAAMWLETAGPGFTPADRAAVEKLAQG